MKYVNNDKQLGIEVDWKKVEKEYKRLNCPKGFFNLLDTDIRNSKWVIAMSTRAGGKTTNTLLIGMILYKLYGIKTCWVRSHDFMITKKMCGDIFNVILEFNYVNKIFEGKYNSIKYFGGRFFLCLVDTETGEIVEQDQTEFCRLFSIQSQERYKSTVNDYYNDFICYDEFVSSSYLNDEFTEFQQLVSTLFRLRLSGHIVLLSNTVDKYSEWFKELCIFDDIQKMEFGDSKTIESPLGTRVNVNFLQMGVTQKKMRNDQIKAFFGFPNPKLASITGSATWAIKNYQRIPKELVIEKEYDTRRYILFNGRLVRMRFIYEEKHGYMLLFTRATKQPENSITYTIDEITDKKQKYKMGTSKTDKFLWNYYNKNKAYFGTNEEGYTIERFVQACK